MTKAPRQPAVLLIMTNENHHNRPTIPAPAPLTDERPTLPPASRPDYDALVDSEALCHVDRVFDEPGRVRDEVEVWVDALFAGC